METRFIHKISKGSRYNQIYVPRGMNEMFEIGDIVEVKLVKKKREIYYSKNLKKLSDFKEKLIKEIFSFLSRDKEIKQIFIFGSFLTKKIDYNDIDIMIIVEKDNEKFEKMVYEDLINKFNLKFHLIGLEKDKINGVLMEDPIMRSMLYYYVSDKNFEISKQKRVNINGLKFLLMLPEDLLKIDLDNGKIYYDSLRRLICIEYFLKNDEIGSDKIDDILKNSLNEEKIDILRKNGLLEKPLLKEIKVIIRDKLKIINRALKNG